MNTIISFANFVGSNWQSIVDAIAAISTAGWAICEVLARIPSIKANTTFEVIYNWLSKSKQQ